MFKIFLELIFSFIASFFFALIMNSPKKILFYSSLLASISYLVYNQLALSGNEMMGFFLGTLVVALIGEWFATRFKMPATIFIFPALIPIVPGYGIYKTIFTFVQDDIILAIRIGFNTILNIGTMAVAMALANIVAHKMRFNIKK